MDADNLNYEQLENFQDQLHSNSTKYLDEVFKQILFIDSAAIAILGTVISKPVDNLLMDILVTIAVSSFILSIIMVILSFLNSMILYGNARDVFSSTIKTLRNIHPEKRKEFYDNAEKSIPRSSSAIPPVFSMVFFALGLFVLSSIILINVWI